MSDEFKVIEGKEDVVNVLENRPNNLIPESMFKVEDLRILLLCKLIGINPNDWDEKDKYPERKKYLMEGLDAELLSLKSAKWKRGKVRISVNIEFSPDEVESPLDEFRNQ